MQRIAQNMQPDKHTRDGEPQESEPRQHIILRILTYRATRFVTDL
jgi:hypothetical protein